MICKLCAWAADLRGDAEWIEGGGQLKWYTKYGHSSFAIPGQMKAAAIEGHAECAGKGKQQCDCQHWFGSVKLGPPLIQHFPPRCSVCYRRGAVTEKGGVLWRHKANHLMKHKRRGPVCPGSGKPPLERGTAPTAIWSSLWPANAMGDD